MTETTTPAPKHIDIYADTRGPAKCKGCGRAIEWATIVASGKKMCFDGAIVALSGYPHKVSGRRVESVDLATNHWATCPAAALFKRKKPEPQP